MIARVFYELNLIQTLTNMIRPALIYVILYEKTKENGDVFI